MRFVGVLGLFVMLGIAWALSTDRKRIPWRTVIGGTALQLVFALLILKTGLGRAFFEHARIYVTAFLNFADAGSEFIFGEAYTEHFFAFKVLPTIIFFGGFMAVLYYLGIMQKVIEAMSRFMRWTIGTSGAETLSCSANIFVGQTEAPLLIKPYIQRMTRSELLAVMIGGMATIAGGVMAAYITFLGGNDPDAQARWASHLLTASVLSAPAALLTAKILVPQEEEIDTRLHLNDERPGANVLDAVVIGTTDGVRLAVNVGAMLIVFTALVAMGNWMLSNWLGSWTGLNDWIRSVTGGTYDSLSLELLLGLLGAPMAWLMGIDSQHLLNAGRLLGERAVLNEFYAYVSMNRLQASGELTDERTRIILAYALCGFSNLVSIGIQVGGIGSIAPTKRADLARLGWRALLGSTIACSLTACVVAMIV